MERHKVIRHKSPPKVSEPFHPRKAIDEIFWKPKLCWHLISVVMKKPQRKVNLCNFPLFLKKCHFFSIWMMCCALTCINLTGRHAKKCEVLSFPFLATMLWCKRACSTDFCAHDCWMKTLKKWEGLWEKEKPHSVEICCRPRCLLLSAFCLSLLYMFTCLRQDPPWGYFSNLWS